LFFILFINKITYEKNYKIKWKRFIWDS
jgi:hypothetical protein